MIGKIQFTVSNTGSFVLAGSKPKELVVRNTSPPGAATVSCSLVADHGWAEVILFSNSSVDHANDIGSIIADKLGIPCLKFDPSLG